jgi:hypothetical protein
MKNLVVVFILISIASCNPAKKLARQQKQYMQVVDGYNKDHPVRIDTTTKYLPGQIITNTVSRIDTVVKYKTDTLTGEMLTEIVYEKGNDIYHTRIDTLLKTIVPTDQIELLKKLNNQLTTEKNEAVLKASKKEKWFWLFIIASMTTVIFLITTLKKTN